MRATYQCKLWRERERETPFVYIKGPTRARCTETFLSVARKEVNELNHGEPSCN